jgi:hypothetical protein
VFFILVACLWELVKTCLLTKNRPDLSQRTRPPHYSTGNREPSQQQDFSTGASQLYILSAAEVAQYAGLLQSG